MDGQNLTPRQREKRSEETAKLFDPAEDMTHQEFKDETDTNKILARFNVTGQMPGMRPLTFGEADYDLDLQRALQAIHHAREAHANLPPALQAKYPTWQRMLNAAEAGTFTTTREEQPPKTPVSQKDTDNPPIVTTK